MPSKPKSKKTNSRPKRAQLSRAEVIARDRRLSNGESDAEFNDDELAALYWFALLPLRKEHQDKFAEAGWTHWSDDVWDDSNLTVATFWDAFVLAPDKALKVIQRFRNLIVGSKPRVEKIGGQPTLVTDSGFPFQFSDAIRMTLLAPVNPEQCAAAQQDADLAFLTGSGNTATAAESAGRRIRRHLADTRRPSPG